MRRLRFTFTALSALLACLLIPCWLVQRHDSDHLGLGRGYHSLEFTMGRDTLTFELLRYDVPLVQHDSKAQFLRTHGYGWFVGPVRGYYWGAGNLKLIHEEAHYRSRPGIFLTSWRLTIPYWFALLATSILPALWLKRRLTPTHRGFPLDQPVSSKPLQPPPVP